MIMKSPEIGDMSPEYEDNKIRLPDSEKEVERLKRKLEEYRKRYGYRAPEQISVHARLKNDILEELLEQGEISKTEIAGKLINT